MKVPFSIMGILNVTPDSFSDGGRFLRKSAALKQIESLIESGADIIDIGAESTRPGSNSIDQKLEWARLEPILSEIWRFKKEVRFSLDTQKEVLFFRALDMGIDIINDVGAATRKLKTLEKLVQYKSVIYLAMHKKGSSKTMQKNPLGGKSALRDVEDFFKNKSSSLARIGFSKSQIWLDPGIGFGKDDAANITLLYNMPKFAKSYNVVTGLSRKGFIGRLFEISDPKKRDPVCKAFEFGLAASNCKVIRTHDVENLSRLRRLIYKREPN